MNKKDKKRLQVLNQRIQKLRLQLAGARQQGDDPEEFERLERELTSAQSEVAKLKAP